jgi:membrane protein DedA with SNARE-associated domain
MEAAITGVLALLGASLGPAQPGARVEFGTRWTLVIVLDVINTVIVVLYLWRIWREKPGPVQPRTGREQA